MHYFGKPETLVYSEGPGMRSLLSYYFGQGMGVEVRGEVRGQELSSDMVVFLSLLVTSPEVQCEI